MKNAKAIISILVVILILAGLWYSIAQRMESKPNAESSGPMPMPVAECVFQDVTNYGQYSGNLASIESVQVRARVKGFLRSVTFEDGAFVEKGDLLFEIEPDEYQARRDRAFADLKSAEADLNRAQQDYERAQEAIEIQIDAVSQQEVSRYKAEYEMARAKLLAAQSALQQAELDLSYTKITSPIEGKISRRYVDAGNLVGASEQTLLAEIVRLDPLYVYFNVSESEYLDYQQNVRENMAEEPNKLPVYISLSNAEEYNHQGRLDYMDNRVDPATGTLQIRGEIPNPDRLLYPGMFVNIRVPVKSTPNAVLIPDKAIMTDLGGKYVLTVDDENVLRRQNLKLGPTRDTLRVITEGLTGNEVFIVGGFAMARPGMPITPMSGDGPPPGTPGATGQDNAANSSEKQPSNKSIPPGGE